MITEARNTFRQRSAREPVKWWLECKRLLDWTEYFVPTLSSYFANFGSDTFNQFIFTLFDKSGAKFSWKFRPDWSAIISIKLFYNSKVLIFEEFPPISVIPVYPFSTIRNSSVLLVKLALVSKNRNYEFKDQQMLKNAH